MDPVHPLIVGPLAVAVAQRALKGLAAAIRPVSCSTQAISACFDAGLWNKRAIAVFLEY